jgi:hypothetical protein
MRTLLLVIISALLFQGHPLPTKKLLINSSSGLVIKGNSNVNSFICKSNGYSRFDTLEYTVDRDNRAIKFVKDEMILLVNEFDCGNAMMTQDFLDALKYKEYPFLKVNFVSLNGIEWASSGGTVLGNVKITLAGSNKNYQIAFKVSGNTKDLISLSGKQKVTFSDFGLTPPRKMMGLIHVKEDLEVEFKIDLRAI